MIINFKGYKISVGVKRIGFLGKIFGLMFRTSGTENLLFEFRKSGFHPIHSFFVFFPFLAVWLDGDDSVLGWKVVRPFRFSVNSERKFRKLVEIPINNKNRKI